MDISAGSPKRALATEVVAGLERAAGLIRSPSPPGGPRRSPPASTLATLERSGPCRLTSLAASQGVTQPAMTQLIARLREAGPGRTGPRPRGMGGGRADPASPPMAGALAGPPPGRQGRAARRVQLASSGRKSRPPWPRPCRLIAGARQPPGPGARWHPLATLPNRTAAGAGGPAVARHRMEQL